MGWKQAEKAPDAPPPARGLARFIIILLCLFAGLGLVVMYVSEPDPAPVATPEPTTAVSQSVAVDAAPAVNVASNPVVNVAPAAPAPVDNTAVLMAADTARDARQTADNALGAANALAPRVSAVETNVAPLSPTLVYFETEQTALSNEMARLWTGFVFSVLGMMAIAIGLAIALFGTARRSPTLTVDYPHRLRLQPEPEPVRTVPSTTRVPEVAPISTVQNGAGTVLETSAEPDKLDPTLPLSRAERAAILHWYTVLHSYTAVAKYLYGYKNVTTFNRVKQVIEEVQ